jgi:hypothetical protein
VRVGMEASGHSRWFQRLLAELQFELWVGDAAKIHTKRVRKHKTDRQDAPLILDLMLKDDFPIIIGTDFHPEFQQIASVDTDIGEFQEKRLTHPEEAEEFYLIWRHATRPLRISAFHGAPQACAIVVTSVDISQWDGPTPLPSQQLGHHRRGRRLSRHFSAPREEDWGSRPRVYLFYCR